MKFVPFGDSHSVFWGRQQSFDTPASNVADTPRLHWMGPAKIYGLENPTNNQTREKFALFQREMQQHTDSVAIACFGEIDIRVNIAKLVLEHRDFTHVRRLADLYLRKLNELPNDRIVIWGPPPASMDAGGELLLDYPVYGDGMTRNAIVHLFNQALLTRINDYPRIRFITLFYDLVDAQLVTRDGALHDANHLSIAHYDQARSLLDTVLGDEVKAALHVSRMQAVSPIHFFRAAPSQETLGYVANMQFSGEFKFQYFTNLAFHSGTYTQTEILLRPGTPTTEVQRFAQIGSFAFVELFFPGTSVDDLAAFERFCEALNGTSANIFDTRDEWADAFQAFLQAHQKKMRLRLATQ
ncbi:MAG: hypothetical protein H7Y28_03305 [Rhodoferax sp.]|nr:hypothetical protein [Rhodoferax sp.]